MKLEDKILNRVDELSDKLNSMSGHAWDLLIKYEIAMGIIGIIVTIAIVVISLLLLKHIFNQYTMIDLDNPKNYKIVKETVYSVFGESREEGKKKRVRFPYMFDDYGDATPFGVSIMVIEAFFIVAAIICLFSLLPISILHIVSPEIYAIKDIINQLKQ